MSIGSQIVTQFGPKSDEPSILSKCEELINIFGLSAEELFLKWESFVITRSVDNELELSVENLNKLQSHIQTALVKKNKQAQANNSTIKAKHHRQIKMAPNFNSPNSSTFMNMIPSTPVSSTKKRKLTTPSSSHSHLNTTPTGGTSKNGGPNTSITSIDLRSVEGNSELNSTKTPETPSLHQSVESGKIIESLNSHLNMEINGNANGVNGSTDESSSLEIPKVKITANFNPSKYKFRTMNQKLLEAADVLDEQIDNITKVVLENYKLDINDFSNPCLASSTEIITVGRIVPDSPLSSYDTELNATSLFLETSRSSGIGQRISLKLDKLQNFSFFPGQIVALKGRNPSGEFFEVHETIEIPYLNAPVSTKDDLITYKNILNNNNLKIVVTSGPYTTSKELDYSNLKKFVEKMNNEVKPNVIVMTGPFIDITHPRIVDGTLSFKESEIDQQQQQQPKTLDEVFKFHIAPILKNLLPTINVILIPSTKDANNKHAAYPQDSFDRKLLGLTKNFKCFPDPCTFQLNEVLIGVSNMDIFKDLKDVNKGSYAKQLRFDRISDHLIQQRRYYPIFPGSVKFRKSTTGSFNNQVKPLSNANTNNGNNTFTNGGNSGITNPHTVDDVILDDSEIDNHISGSDLHLPYMGLTEFGGVIPDILILPSELKQFARVVKNVVVINPGCFMKQATTGSYAVVSVKSPEINENEDDDDGAITDLDKIDGDLYVHNIWKRGRVDLVRT
ncbi:hypothetical protein BVG19_g729 [[Candida] boidinii]|nr:hypothetical protein BVG19_g729 [[Candida] boidinii]OWB49263.1 hypothetical protein B5S27_g803 [[Candida] boidinii]